MAGQRKVWMVPRSFCEDGTRPGTGSRESIQSNSEKGIIMRAFILSAIAGVSTLGLLLGVSPATASAHSPVVYRSYHADHCRPSHHGVRVYAPAYCGPRVAVGVVVTPPPVYPTYYVPVSPTYYPVPTPYYVPGTTPPVVASPGY